jgi:hypothetical protein
VSNTPTSTRIEVAVIVSQLETIKEKLECLNGYDIRIKNVEKVAWLLTGVGSLLAAILVPIAVAAIRKWFGL